MGLSVGIVGLPNAGKSTLFNALASRRLAETAPREFTTIDPHEAVVPLHDENFHRLVDLVNPEKSVPATVTFIDIAGLVRDAHKGEGLGNQFLGKIREVDAIVHVVRAFPDDNVSHVHTSHPVATKEQIYEDIELVNLEIELADIENKPTIYVLNTSEKDINSVSINRFIDTITKRYKSKALSVAAKTEEEMIELSNEERAEMFKVLEWERSVLERLVETAYKLLGLISFYTIKGGKEASAWSIKKGSNAVSAAERVHTDFSKNFIKAEVVEVGKLLKVGGWKEAKQKGLIRLEGKDYMVKDKDVIEFKVGS